MSSLKEEFLSYMKNPPFPCIGAKAALKKNGLSVVVAKDLNSPDEDVDLLVSIYRFISLWKRNKRILRSFVIIFESPLGNSEIEFEQNLWAFLQRLHHLDKEIYHWDEQVNADVTNPHFSFSLGQMSFFIIGLHPHSSRKARQFTRPTLVFNLHEQFEQLRTQGKFSPMQSKIRERDISYSGSINPMLENFGEKSEAYQYSGRQIQKETSIPFKRENVSELPWQEIPPCSGIASLKKGQLLVVKDKLGSQVADLFCFAKDNHDEFFSSGKSIDYNQKIYFSVEDHLFSNESNIMLSIIHDDVRRHDVLFAPCSRETFHIIYGETEQKTGCFEHLAQAFAPYQFPKTQITTTFNIFMHTTLTPKGKARVKPPLSKAGDKIIFRSHMDLIVGLTACSAPESNNFSLKPIQYKII
ncbi:MAG: YqcI/YcgG family protein [Legionella sp.]|nr:YqcI/YcgG family protein [Legionella sp.]